MMVPFHSAGDVGLGASLPVSRDLDPRLLKPKQGSMVACLPAVSGLLVRLGLPIRCTRRKVFSRVVTSIIDASQSCATAPASFSQRYFSSSRAVLIRLTVSKVTSVERETEWYGSLKRK